jgi:hypothetical protein
MEHGEIWEPKCQGAVFPAEKRSNSVRRFSREIQKAFSGSFDRICACVPQPEYAVLDSLSVRHLLPFRCLRRPLLLLAACCTWIPRPATFDRSDCFQRPSSHTTTGPYPSRLLLPSPPTTTTNSPYRLRHIDTPDPTGPYPRCDPISLCAPSLFRRDALAIIIHALRQLLAHAETSQPNCLPRHCLAA